MTSRGVRAARCPICEGDIERRTVTDRCLASGMTDLEALRRLRALDWTSTLAAIAGHRDHWLTRLEARGSLDQERVTRDITSGKRTQSGRRDLAILVRDEAVRVIEAGDVSVSVAEGLRAQQLIDHREQRDADRNLTISMARMLHGQAPPARVIEGEASDVVGIQARHPDAHRAPLHVQGRRGRLPDHADDDALPDRVGAGSIPMGSDALRP
jgi:hypothetical protein